MHIFVDMPINRKHVIEHDLTYDWVLEVMRRTIRCEIKHYNLWNSPMDLPRCLPYPQHVGVKRLGLTKLGSIALGGRILRVSDHSAARLQFLFYLRLRLPCVRIL